MVNSNTTLILRYRPKSSPDVELQERHHQKGATDYHTLKYFEIGDELPRGVKFLFESEELEYNRQLHNFHGKNLVPKSGNKFGDEDRLPVVSDGGSTSYYELPKHATELRHLISAKGMSKSRGDIFKACYRLGEKDGASTMYDLKKMKFFIDDLIEMYERGEHI